MLPPPYVGGCHFVAYMELFAGWDTLTLEAGADLTFTAGEARCLLSRLWQS